MLPLERSKSREAFGTALLVAHLFPQDLGQARVLDLLLPAVHQALIGFGAFLDGVNCHGLKDCRGGVEGGQSKGEEGLGWG